MIDTQKLRSPWAEVFVQWKGTDACFDFKCPDCGGGHYDGYNAYIIRCKCGQLWRMPSYMQAERVDDADGYQPEDLTMTDKCGRCAGHGTIITVDADTHKSHKQPCPQCSTAFPAWMLTEDYIDPTR